MAAQQASVNNYKDSEDNSSLFVEFDAETETETEAEVVEADEVAEDWSALGEDTHAKNLDATQLYLNEIGFSPLLSAEEYSRLKRLDRRVLGADELSDQQLDAVRAARVPAEFAGLDHELKD